MKSFWLFACFYLAGIAFLFSFLLTPLMRRLSFRWSVLDHPGGRKNQREPMPLLGGLGMFVSFGFVVLFHLALAVFFRFHPEAARRLPVDFNVHLPGMMTVLPRLAVILGGAAAILVLGLVDDLRGLGAGRKLFFQILIALFLVFAGVKATVFVHNHLVGAVVTVLWVVGITNAFNLLDNMDGLSAGVALVSSVIFFLYAFLTGQLFVSSLLAVLIGTLAGFLPYNFHPARIYMGDSGSLFLGYIMSVLTIISTYYTPASSTMIAIAAPLLILGVPIFDTITVCAIRLKAGRPLFVGDRNHFSHRLVALGMSVPRAVLFICLVSFGIGVSSLLLNRAGTMGAIIILVQAAAIFTIIALLEQSGRKND